MSRVGFELGVGGVTVFEDCEATALITQSRWLDSENKGFKYSFISV